eukprot:Nk52_evm141s226 gene=Nk52_evmTU141s226
MFWVRGLQNRAVLWSASLSSKTNGGSVPLRGRGVHCRNEKHPMICTFSKGVGKVSVGVKGYRSLFCANATPLSTKVNFTRGFMGGRVVFDGGFTRGRDRVPRKRTYEPKPKPVKYVRVESEEHFMEIFHTKPRLIEFGSVFDILVKFKYPNVVSHETTKLELKRFVRAALTKEKLQVQLRVLAKVCSGESDLFFAVTERWEKMVQKKGNSGIDNISNVLKYMQIGKTFDEKSRNSVQRIFKWGLRDSFESEEHRGKLLGIVLNSEALKMDIPLKEHVYNKIGSMMLEAGYYDEFIDFIAKTFLQTGKWNYSFSRSSRDISEEEIDLLTSMCAKETNRPGYALVEVSKAVMSISKVDISFRRAVFKLVAEICQNQKQLRISDKGYYYLFEEVAKLMSINVPSKIQAEILVASLNVLDVNSTTKKNCAMVLLNTLKKVQTIPFGLKMDLLNIIKEGWLGGKKELLSLEIDLCAANGVPNMACDIFEEAVRNKSVEITDATVVNILHCAADAPDRQDQILSIVMDMERNVNFGLNVYNKLVWLNGKRKDFNFCLHILKLMEGRGLHPDEVTFASMTDMFRLNLTIVEDILSPLISENTDQLPQDIFRTSISAFTEHGMVSLADFILDGVDFRKYISNAKLIGPILIFYGKREQSSEKFEELSSLILRESNRYSREDASVLHNIILHSYIHKRNKDKALHLFRRMISKNLCTKHTFRMIAQYSLVRPSLPEEFESWEKDLIAANIEKTVEENEVLSQLNKAEELVEVKSVLMDPLVTSSSFLFNSIFLNMCGRARDMTDAINSLQTAHGLQSRGKFTIDHKMHAVFIDVMYRLEPGSHITYINSLKGQGVYVKPMYFKHCLDSMKLKKDIDGAWELFELGKGFEAFASEKRAFFRKVWRIILCNGYANANVERLISVFNESAKSNIYMGPAFYDSLHHVCQERGHPASHFFTESVDYRFTVYEPPMKADGVEELRGVIDSGNEVNMGMADEEMVENVPGPEKKEQKHEFEIDTVTDTSVLEGSKTVEHKVSGKETAERKAASDSAFFFEGEKMKVKVDQVLDILDSTLMEDEGVIAEDFALFQNTVAIVKENIESSERTTAKSMSRALKKFGNIHSVFEKKDPKEATSQ